MNARNLVAVCLVIVGIALLSCRAGLGQNGTKADIRGTIKIATAAKGAGEALGVILVEGPKEQMYDKASIKVTKETKIFRQVGKERKAGAFEDLKIGASVEVRFVGPVAESYPVQARAGEIVILAALKQ